MLVILFLILRLVLDFGFLLAGAIAIAVAVLEFTILSVFLKRHHTDHSDRIG